MVKTGGRPLGFVVIAERPLGRGFPVIIRCTAPNVNFGPPEGLDVVPDVVRPKTAGRNSPHGLTAQVQKLGGGNRTRTDDPLLAKQRDYLIFVPWRT